MPPKAQSKAVAEEQDWTSYKDKAPTALQERFVGWITEETTYNPAAAKTKAEAFAAGVRLATALRMPFQRSPQNQEALEEARAATAERKAARAAEPAPAKKTAAVPAASKKAAPAKKTTARKAAKAVPEPEPDEVEEEVVDLDQEETTPAPKAARSRRPAKRARASAAQEDEAPF
jgi:hypothetical protein